MKDLFNEEYKKDFYVQESKEYINNIMQTEEINMKNVSNNEIFKKLQNDAMNHEEK